MNLLPFDFFCYDSAKPSFCPWQIIHSKGQPLAQGYTSRPQATHCTIKIYPGTDLCLGGAGGGVNLHPETLVRREFCRDAMIGAYLKRPSKIILLQTLKRMLYNMNRQWLVSYIWDNSVDSRRPLRIETATCRPESAKLTTAPRTHIGSVRQTTQWKKTLKITLIRAILYVTHVVVSFFMCQAVTY